VRQFFAFALALKICSYLCWHCQGGQKTISRLDTDCPAPSTNDARCESSVWTYKEQAALLGLSRACRALQAAAQPFLYHYLYTSKKSDLYLFVRTLSERPDLGLGISEIEIAHASEALKTTSDESCSLTKLITDIVESHPRRGSLVYPLDARTLDRSPAGGAQEGRFEDSGELSKTTEYWVFVSLLLQLTPNLARSRSPARPCVIHDACSVGYSVGIA